MVTLPGRDHLRRALLSLACLVLMTEIPDNGRGLLLKMYPLEHLSGQCSQLYSTVIGVVPYNLLVLDL